MKLQNLIIIFIIIIIPIILIFSYYLGLEADTIRMQTDYDEKLIEATGEAVEAFEINTIEWNSEYNTLANNKRRDLLSSINVFTTSLANKLGIGGTSKENILNYVPAIVYIMYDGYYIYSPTHVPQTLTDDNGLQLYYYKHSDVDEYITTKATQIKTNTSETVSGEPMYVGNTLTKDYNGESITFTTNIADAKKTYKHVLKTFVPYTSIKGDYVINYTLDNYVRVYGEESQEGYVTDISNWNINPKDILITLDSDNGEVSIGPETLTENIAIRDSKEVAIEIENYKYVYNSNNEKRYYEQEGANKGKFFSIDNYYVKNYDLPSEYKKVLILQNTGDTEYLALYQKLNGDDTFWYYKTGENEYSPYFDTIDNITTIEKYEDCSAINYYVENYCFNNWLDDNDIEIDVTNKNNKIIENINTNLNLAISNYSANSGMNYTIPELSPTDWEQALSNISMITFFQGVKIGLKTYNNYAIVTSTENNEYVAEDSLYYIGDQDQYYHRINCKSSEQLYEAYRNIEFKVKNYKTDGDTNYYYKHKFYDYNTANLECFDCIVNRNNMNESENSTIRTISYNALARERYIQISRTRLIESNGIILEPEDNTETQECTHSNTIIQYNSTEHWYICGDCNSQVGGIQSHTLKYINKIAEPLGNYGHMAECEHCGYIFNEPCQGEDWEYYSRDAHAGTCALCKVDMWQAHQKLNNQIRCFICQ